MQWLLVLFSFMFSILAFLHGCYATASTLLFAGLLRIAILFVKIERPKSYLQSNEPNQSGSMLVSAGPNSDIWYLYLGSRGIIDGLLNKPMVTDVSAHPAATCALIVLEGCLTLSAGFAFAQKGWDGVGVLAILLISRLVDYVILNNKRLARNWMKHYGGKISLIHSTPKPITSNSADHFDIC